MKNIPYTYLIYCKTTQQFYYGVRYSKNCKPDDLWNTYFTSSNYVHDLIKKYGKSDFLFEIRKIFTNSNKARKWEEKVLKKLNVANRTDFINQSNSICPTGQNRVWITKETQNKFIDINEIENYPNWNKGRYFSLDTRKKLSCWQKGRAPNIPNHSIEQKQKWSVMRKGIINSPSRLKPVTINDITYKSTQDASLSTGISVYFINKNYRN